MYRAVECIEKEMYKLSHTRDPFSVGLRDGMGNAADLVQEELHRITMEMEREAQQHDTEAPGLRKAIKLLSDKRQKNSQNF